MLCQDKSHPDKRAPKPGRKYPFFRDWGKKYGGRGDGAERGESSAFEPLVRGVSLNFQLPMICGLSYFITEISTHFKVFILLEQLVYIHNDPKLLYCFKNTLKPLVSFSK